MKIGDDLANSHADGVIRVRWWVVGLSGFVAGIGGLGALAIVATVKNLDTLSTVALALAVLAFVIQIIVFIAEAANSRQQSKSMYEINAETKMLLEELRTRSLVTNEILNHQYNRLLDSLLQRTQETVTEVSSSETLSAEDVARLVSADVRAVVDAARTGINNMSSPVDLGQFQQINLSRSVNYHWPREHVQEILVRSGVSKLSEAGARLLAQFAERAEKTGSDRPRNVLRPSPQATELERMGLIDPQVNLINSRKGYVLTALGWEAVNLIMFKPFPDSAIIRDRFPWLKFVRDDLRSLDGESDST